MSRVAFIGLGKMGSGMAARLLSAGHDVVVFNRSADKARELAGRGARVAATPRHAASGCDAVFSMVADDEALRAVWLGADGALAADLGPGTLAIECSTLSHDWVMELAGEAGGRGLRYLDSPVTGLPAAAAAGDLTLLVGAEPEDLALAQPLLTAVSRRIVHFGPVGAGTAYKLMVNLLGAVQIASAAEGMAIAERAGLNLSVVADAIATGQAGSPQVVRNTRRIAEDSHDREVVFTPALRLKDIEYALRLSQKLGIGSPFGALAARAFRSLCEMGYAQANESRIVEVARARKPSESDQG